jgi:hypothetical protein
MKSYLIVIIPLCMISLSGNAEEYSDLWGKRGEKWSPAGRLPDFSYAGYRHGETPIPKGGKVHSIKTFGAKGDGVTDDTKAFLAAIEKVHKGVIFIPEGKYIITDILEIETSSLVLRGAGRGKTILYFPKPGNDIRPKWGKTTSGRRTSEYSWKYALVMFQGDEGLGLEDLAKVERPAKRGDRVLSVSTTRGIKVGEYIQLRQVDKEPGGSLIRHLYAGDPGNADGMKGRTQFVTRVSKVSNGKITIDRPLRYDVDPEWSPSIQRFSPTVQDSGIEDLSFEFPPKRYKGHFTELGYTPVAFRFVAHCWARNIGVLNAENGFFIRNGYFCTIDGVRFKSNKKLHWGFLSGHHGFIAGGPDNLITNFKFETRFFHDITVSTRSEGNVFSNGSGLYINMDHHKHAPYANLFTNIDFGKGRRGKHRPFSSSGGGKTGRNAAALNTYWNIYSGGPEGRLKAPPKGFGPAMLNVVYNTKNDEAKDPARGNWIENIPSEHIFPKNLHEAQLARRLTKAE